MFNTFFNLEPLDTDYAEQSGSSSKGKGQPGDAETFNDDLAPEYTEGEDEEPIEDLEVMSIDEANFEDEDDVAHRSLEEDDEAFLEEAAEADLDEGGLKKIGDYAEGELAPDDQEAPIDELEDGPPLGDTEEPVGYEDAPIEDQEPFAEPEGEEAPFEDEDHEPDAAQREEDYAEDELAPEDQESPIDELEDGLPLGDTEEPVGYEDAPIEDQEPFAEPEGEEELDDENAPIEGADDTEVLDDTEALDDTEGLYDTEALDTDQEPIAEPEGEEEEPLEDEQGPLEDELGPLEDEQGLLEDQEVPIEDEEFVDDGVEVNSNNAEASDAIKGGRKKTKKDKSYRHSDVDDQLHEVPEKIVSFTGREVDEMAEDESEGGSDNVNKKKSQYRSISKSKTSSSDNFEGDDSNYDYEDTEADYNRYFLSHIFKFVNVQLLIGGATCCSPDLNIWRLSGF
jgi:hypothetical protein